MGKRPRKEYQVLVPVVRDELAFSKNKCSDNARKIATQIEKIEIDIWLDKHYLGRLQHGDENGERVGIDIESIKNLVIVSIKHLFYYSVKLKNFIFVNHEDENRFGRIVLQKKDAEGQLLNVVVEYHYISLNQYEVTVKTAMREDNFRLSEGQYLIEIVNDEESELKKKEGNRIKKVSSYLK
jgi:hypothetical protein